MRHRTLHAYLLREITGPFLAGLVFLVQLFFVIRLLAQANVIFGSSLSAQDLGKLVLYLLPSMLSYGLPIAFLLGILVALGRMADDREITAFASTGHGPHLFLPAPLAGAVVLAAAMLALTCWLEPFALKNANALLASVIKRNLAGDVKPGVFYEDLADLTIFAGKVERRSGQLQDVMVHDARTPDAPLLMVARRGNLDASGPGGSLVLGLQDGEVHRAVVGGSSYSVATFDRGSVAVAVKQQISSKSRRRLLEDRTPSEILQMADYQLRRKQVKPHYYYVEYHRRFAHPAVLLSFALVGVAVAGSRPGQGRGGRAGAFLWTLGSIVAYFVLGKAFIQLGNRGLLPAILAAWAPTLILAALGGGVLLRRSRVG